MTMYDAIIVGARCAGAATALLLARGGYRVLLVDRATFPSDTLSTHYIHNTGAALLHNWGLLERVAATGCPPITRCTLDLGPLALTGTPPPAGEVAAAYAPRRTLLDTILVEAAVAAGAELRAGFALEGLLSADGVVTGIRGRGRDGAIAERARIVIGADGLRSLVARAVAAPTYNERPALTCMYYAYWRDVPITGVEIYPRERRMLLAFPTNDGCAVVITVWPRGEFDIFRADVRGNYLRTLELAPPLAERVRDGRRESRVMGTADLPNFFRRPYGPGWALVGDAGFHKDPVLAQGIKDAFRDAALLAEAIDAGFSGRLPLTEALAGYERRRNEAVMPIYELTCQRASLAPPPPEMQRFLTALAGNQREIDRFWGVDAGTVPVQEFFSPEHIGRVLAEADAPA
jgi:flavin-dependent dehydrogenase